MPIHKTYLYTKKNVHAIAEYNFIHLQQKKKESFQVKLYAHLSYSKHKKYYSLLKCYILEIAITN